MKFHILFLSLVLSILLFPQSKIIYYAHISGEIDLGKAPYVKRVISEAQDKKADAIIFEINTFGGRVDAATQIKDAILESSVPTVAFINKRAVSAGALISLACKKIIMTPGSIIGATTVVDQEGKKQSEKYQSYMRSEMRSTAEKNGRRGDIAEAMVDERISIPGIDDSTTLLTLTYEEAQKLGISDTVMKSKEEVYAFLNILNPVVVETQVNWAEKAVAFLNNPVVSSVLVMIGLIGLYSELKAPGLALPGIAGFIAFALFFGSSYLLQLASSLQIILFITGFILLLIEIFFIPGFGFTGVSGIALILGSIFFSLFNMGPLFDVSLFKIAIIQMAAILTVSIGLISVVVRFLPQSDRFQKLTLHTENASATGFVSTTDNSHLVNQIGESLTPLRPAGIIVIDEKHYDVVTEGSYIESKKQVKVISVDGRKIIVSEITA